MKIAIIDLGTNTFNLLIRELSLDSVVHSSKLAVKLGEGGITRNVIAEIPFSRGLKAMIEFASICKKHEVDEIIAIATSAIRHASNGTDFCEAVHAHTGIPIEIIDGLREAELILKGVQSAMELPADPYLVIDIGGGSTEFILAKGKETIWMKSYPLGVSRLLEQFQPSDRMEYSERELIMNYFDSELADLKEQIAIYNPKVLIGSSGSFDTLADICRMQMGEESTDLEDPSYLFDLGVYKWAEKIICESNFEQRLAIPGMTAMRADMIVLSAMLIGFTLQTTQIRSMWLSKYALKEGVYFNFKANRNA